MNEDNLVQPGENDVRLPWKLRDVQSKPVSQTMHQLAHNHFRPGVLASYAAHHLASLG